MTGRPLDVLEDSVGEDVSVELKGGDVLEGELAGYDEHMNLVVEGEATTVVRGDNVVSITL